MIRDNAKQYKKAYENHIKKSKLSAAPFKNCVQTPLLDLPDGTSVAEILPLMELHLFSGNTNHLYSIGDKILSKTETLISMDMWNKVIGIIRPRLHSGQFKRG